METVKNTVKAATGPDSQFEPGHQLPIHHQDKPGRQADMKGPAPVDDQVPTEDNGYQPYRAAGKLRGKRAIITGGDSGIGRAVAILFAMEGADSLIVYLPAEQKDAESTKAAVEKHGRRCVLLAIDVQTKENCLKIVDEAVATLGGIDILVNNAAYQNVVPDLADLSEDQWVRTFDTNIHPYFYLSKYCVPYMQRGSTIINNASVNAYIGRPDLIDYSATKGAIVALTRCLSNQLCGPDAKGAQGSKLQQTSSSSSSTGSEAAAVNRKPGGIRVNAVCPGPIWTPLIPSTMTTEAQDGSGGYESTPMGRPGQPSEVATCFVFLASMDSSFISGQCLHPNGGVVVNG